MIGGAQQKKIYFQKFFNAFESEKQKLYGISLKHKTHFSEKYLKHIQKTDNCSWLCLERIRNKVLGFGSSLAAHRIERT